QVQVFKNKMETIESTMDRVKTFATRLKVITNIEDRGGLLQSLNEKKIPDSTANLGAPTAPTAEQRDARAAQAAIAQSNDPEDVQLRKKYDQLDEQFTLLNHDSL